MTERKRRFSWDQFIAISAVIVAMASIGITVWVGAITREHNRLSVRPQLEIYFDLNNSEFGYVVTNNGLGPARITERHILVDGTEIENSGLGGIGDFLAKLNLTQERVASIGLVKPGFTIRPGESEKLILLRLLKEDRPEELMTGIYERVSIRIGYESMYKESFLCKIPSE